MRAPLPSPRAFGHIVLAGLLAAAGASALAQQAALRGWTGGPTFEASVARSEVRSSPQVNGADTVVRLSPGLDLRGQFGRTRVALGYTLHGLKHTREGAGSEFQNSLNSSLSSELLDNLLFLNGSATVTSSSLDAFGQQSAPGSLLSNSNRAEVASVNLSPSLRGRLGDAATMELRVNATATNTRRSKTGDSTAYGAALSMGSNSRNTILGWGLQASRQRNEFRVGGGSTQDIATASLTIRPDSDLQITLRGGAEANDVLAGERRRYDTAGGAVSWTPSPRTSASFETDHRYFGNSNRFSLQYRTPRSVWRMGGSRDVTSNGNAQGGTNPFTLGQLLDALLLSAFPDPAQREAAVTAALEGRDPNSVVGGGFVSTSQSLLDRVDLGWTYSGLRLTLSLQAMKSKTKNLVNGSFDGEPVRQTSYTSSVNYRLTPSATLSLTGQRTMTLGTSLQAGTDLKSLALGYTDQLSRLLSATLSLRYSVFNSATSPYRETAATAAISLRF